MTATETASRRRGEGEGHFLLPPGWRPPASCPCPVARLLGGIPCSLFLLSPFTSSFPPFLPSFLLLPSLPPSPLSPFCRFRWPRIIWPQKVEEARENGTRKIWPRVSVTITKRRRGAGAAAGRIRRVLALAPVLLDNRGGGAGQGPAVVVRPSVQETSTFLSLSLSLLHDNDLQGH